MTIFELNIFWFTVAPSYYWLMYALSFLIWYVIIKRRLPLSQVTSPSMRETKNNKEAIFLLDDLFFYVFLWVILWGRLGYVFFYNFSSYINDPISILKVWEWWMSFHGWVVWVILAMYLFTRRFKLSFLNIADHVTMVLPIWLWLGRIWNYINWELLGYSGYTWFLAVYKNGVWYFPSPLVEAFLEWFILYFILLFFYKNKNLNKWQIACLFLIFYSIFRILVEACFRIPDSHIWYIAWYFTMWELLSLPMLIIWIVLFFRFAKK